MKLKSCALGLVVAATVGSVGCEAEQAPVPAVSGSSNGLLVQTNAVWEADSIEVCWGSPLSAVPDDAEVWLREAIEETWEQVIDVDFTGWGYCDDWPQPQPPRIAVFMFSELEPLDRPSAAVVFPFGDEQELKDMQLSYHFNYAPNCDSDSGPVWGPTGRVFETRREMCFKNVAVHEFGHSLGFWHEQDYDDEPTVCTLEAFQRLSVERYDDYYDPVSLMNYCSPLVATKDYMLTPWDIAGAQERYGLPENDFIWWSHGNINDLAFLAFDEDYMLFDVDKKDLVGAYKGVAGDFDGDGDDDIHWYRGAGTDKTWRSNGDRTFASGLSPGEAGQPDMGGNFQPVAGDFDGDGRDDIFFYNLDTGGEWIWYGSVTNSVAHFTLVAATVSSGYTVFSGDFDGDGRSDLFLYKPGEDNDYVWWGNANRTFTSSSDLDVDGTYEPIVGNFNHTTPDDILWYRSGTANEAVWTGNTNRTFTGHSNVLQQDGTNLKAAVGDFDSNGVDDLYWISTSNNNDRVWLFSGTSTFDLDRVYVPVHANYDYAVVGNFDGDWYDDLMWFNDD